MSKAMENVGAIGVALAGEEVPAAKRTEIPARAAALVPSFKLALVLTLSARRSRARLALRPVSP